MSKRCSSLYIRYPLAMNQASNPNPVPTSLQVLVDKVAHTNSLVVEDGGYQLSKIEKSISSVEMANQIPQKKVFTLKYTNEAEVVPLLEQLLSPQGSIRVEEESLVVIDNKWVIQQITEEIKRLDKFETQKKTQAYPLQCVKAEDLFQSQEFKKATSLLLTLSSVQSGVVTVLRTQQPTTHQLPHTKLRHQV